MKNENQLQYLNALNKINGVGPQKMRKLLAFFPSPEEAWKAGLSDLAQSGIGESLSAKIFSQRKDIEPEEEWSKMAKENIRMLSETDEEYPRLLREIPSSPYLIYMKGGTDLNAPMISIVGSRKFTDYGSQAAYALAKDLASAASR